MDQDRVTTRIEGEDDPSVFKERFELAVRGTNDGFWEWNITENTVWFAPRFKELLGFAEHEIEGSFEIWEALLHTEDRDSTLAAVDAHLQENEPFDVEYRLRTKSGEYRWFRDRGLVVREDDGRPLRMAGAIQDITEIKETEARLREIERRLRSITESSPDYIMLVELDGRIRYINRTVPDLTVDQVVGTYMFDYIPEDCHAGVRACFDRVKESGLADLYETSYVDQGGRISYFESNVGPVVQDGKVVALAITARDATHRIQTEEALRQSEERYRAIVDTTSEWIWEIDLSGRHLFTNLAIESILGYSVTELPTLDTFQLIHPDDRAEVRERYAQSIERRRGWDNWVFRWRHKNGEYRHLESNARPVLGPNGELLGFRGSDRDVTERQSVQERLAHARRLEAIGQLAGGLAHDFNNLLVAVLGQSELLAETVEGPALENVMEIRRAGERAADLTQQLLAFSRKQVLKKEVLDLNQVVEGVVNILSRLIEESIELDIRLADEPLTVRADSSQLEQVVINLATNARDAMPSGGRIAIQTTSLEIDAARCADLGLVEPGKFAVLRVSDDGHGMDAETRARIFEPFFTTKPVGKGTGLGLASVYGTIKQTGGELRVTSEPGTGSVFEVYLPRSGGRVEPSSSSPRAHSGTERILLVEDEPLVATTIAQTLERTGYDVVVASSGHEAMDLTQSDDEQWDLLITDVVMPQMSGVELAQTLRSNQPDLRVLLISGYTDEDVGRVGGDDAGATCLEKPFTPMKLKQTVRRILDN